MNVSIIFWIIVILILIVLWGVHIRRCCKYFDSITERRQRERRVRRRVLQTITISVGRPPYTVEDDFERGVQTTERKFDRDLPTYEEAMEEDMRRTVNQTNISSNQPPPPPPPPPALPRY